MIPFKFLLYFFTSSFLSILALGLLGVNHSHDFVAALCIVIFVFFSVLIGFLVTFNSKEKFENFDIYIKPISRIVSMALSIAAILAAVYGFFNGFSYFKKEVEVSFKFKKELNSEGENYLDNLELKKVSPKLYSAAFDSLTKVSSSVELIIHFNDGRKDSVLVKHAAVDTSFNVQLKTNKADLYFKEQGKSYFKSVSKFVDPNNRIKDHQLTLN